MAQAGLVQAKWTQRILTEMSEALRAKRPDITAEQTENLERLLIRAVRDCVVSGFEPLEAALTLPDEGDRHVLAAAITSGAQTIVTNNLKDFPSDQLQSWNVEARSPDDFLLDQVSLDREVVYAEVVRIADSRSRPPQSVDDVLAQLERSGLTRTVAALRTRRMT